MSQTYPISVDLHVHLRGTIEPETAVRLASQHRVTLPSALFAANGGYRWRGFDEFLQAYDSIGQVIRAPEDLYFLARNYLERCAADGTIYVEFMLSPSHSAKNGIPYREQVSAVATAISDARSNCGIEARLIVTCVRHQKPREALELAELVAENPHPIVVGFGLTGNELLFDVSEFSGAFMVAREAGLGLTAHTGEWAHGKSVLHSVDVLSLTRVGHGIKAVEDYKVLSDLSERGVGFEVCLSSNVALKLCDTFEEHPLPKLIAAGCKVSLATDDPAYFLTSPANEYQLAADRLGLSYTQLRQITIDAMNMAFCDQETKDALLQQVEENDALD